MTGFVSFVSSGPGDPELLTLKAVARLQAADAVLFDDLSSGPILAHVRAGADLVSVGKRAGRVSPRQQHVSRLLVDYATTHSKVVRLKLATPEYSGGWKKKSRRCRRPVSATKSFPASPRPVPRRPRPACR